MLFFCRVVSCFSLGNKKLLQISTLYSQILYFCLWFRIKNKILKVKRVKGPQSITFPVQSFPRNPFIEERNKIFGHFLHGILCLKMSKHGTGVNTNGKEASKIGSLQFFPFVLRFRFSLFTLFCCLSIGFHSNFLY